ncbi:D-glycero-beta-D-manno-heptose-7-phosphate kinase [Flexithrix dorotheae]|uniref:D-glycero-beta-D-manno-heptose-7-phosphate kinase n=1 Tax=Flexithrix dorotheae TaxID=70993 RepID=UPI0003801B4C
MRKVFEKFNDLKVLILGDVMIDSYIWGKVNRISPEAPVPIVSINERDWRLGGAANVALNIKALGAEPILCSVVGDDPESITFHELLDKRGMTKEGIIQSKDRVTTVKHRILAGSQHMLRVDSETEKVISSEDEEKIVEFVRNKIDEIDVIIFEDYDKGVLTEKVIGQVISLAKSKQIPTTVDPKKRNFLAYTGCSLFKPNLKELREGLKVEFENKDIEALSEAVNKLAKVMPVDAVMVTLSENGVYITDFEEKFHLPAHKREIADVSGAGDTVISIMSLCLAVGLPLKKIAGISNLGGGLVCEHLGVVPVEKNRLLEEAIKLFGNE